MDGSPPVVAALEERLEREGALSFEALMELALYHPEGGFYRTGCPPRGRAGGHYATCPRLDPALGRAVAGWLADARGETLGGGGAWHVVEVGGGDGTLAETVLSALPLRLRAGLVFHAVEVGGEARAAQRERLAPGRGLLSRVRRAAGPRVVFHETVAEALRAASGEALLYSNELVDAFPAVSLVRAGGRWKEVWLERRGERLVEQLREPGPWAAAEAPVSVLALDVPDGSRAEAHPAYHRFLRALAADWRRGAMLTIDYGGSTAELHGRGGGGTLRAYYRSLRIDGPDELVRRLGQQDLTADVSFTDLAAWGEALGLRTVREQSQRELLGRYGELAAERRRPSLAFVAAEEGAGGAFRVLVQRR